MQIKYSYRAIQQMVKWLCTSTNVSALNCKRCECEAMHRRMIFLNIFRRQNEITKLVYVVIVFSVLFFHVFTGLSLSLSIWRIFECSESRVKCLKRIMLTLF